MRQFFQRLADSLNYDFCPRANRYVYWLKQPIGWFVLAAAAALVIGISVASQALLICGALVAVIILGVAWPWIGIRGVTCSLSFERHRTTEGMPVCVRIAVHNRWPWPVWGLMVERGFLFAESDSLGASPAASLARIPGWSRTVFSWDFHPPRRGLYPTESPRISSGFPFGIWHAHRPVAVENELVVWPRMASLKSIPPIRGRFLAVAGTPSRQVGDEGDMFAVRPYRSGDSLRHVHWSQTAKHDRLVVCERQATGRRPVQLILDVDEQAHQNGQAADSLEEVIRVGASIGRQFHAHNAQVELRVGRRVVVAESGTVGLRRMLDALAIWSPDRDRSASAAYVPDVDARSLLMIVTTRSAVPQWKARLLRHRDAQLIVLAFDDDGQSAEPRSHDGALMLDGRDNPLVRLVHGWERICNDGWARN